MSLDDAAPSWWSANPHRARFERLVLLYTPVWMALMALVMLSGAYRSWGELAYMAFGLAAGAPLLLLPIVLDAPLAERSALRHTCLRLNLWLALFVFVGSYVCTHYFFGVVGMRYGFPTQWTLEAELVGRGPGRVPLFLYPLTHAYFASYHVGATVVHRYLSARLGLGALARLVLLGLLAYGVAFGETFFMAIPALDDVFEYADRGRMLRIGSVFYGSFFIISLPAFAQVEAEAGAPWPYSRVALSSLGTGMAVVLILDLWAKLFGTL